MFQTDFVCIPDIAKLFIKFSFPTKTVVQILCYFSPEINFPPQTEESCQKFQKKENENSLKYSRHLDIEWDRKAQSSTRQHTLPTPPPSPAFCTQTNFAGSFFCVILLNCHFLLIQLSMNCNSLFNIKCHGNEHYFHFFFLQLPLLLQLERLCGKMSLVIVEKEGRNI
jgi:hypothetical protein